MVSIKEEISEAGKNFEIALKNIQDKVAKVGWLKTIRYPQKISDRGPSSQSPTVATIAAMHEFGAPGKNIPARPFMRPTIAKQENSWKKIAFDGSKQVLEGKKTMAEVMEIIGLTAEGDIRKTIKQIFSPALKESTVLARIRNSSKLKKIKNRRLSQNEVGGITKPLIDTGLMLGNLTHSVEDE